MYKTIELTESQIFAVFRSMGATKQITDPNSLPEVNLNFQTARDGLQQLAYNNRTMAEDPEILMPTILELVLYEIDLASLSELVTQENRDQIPDFLLAQ
jgi:hypothetical protein